ncbi:hypothetical protein [Sphingobium lignivorans]|uniref:Uncharacterized protein n=1 Tax=Sphingobium lignivorans TaxID=2735886 RepID=A0ABR6NFC0_9SPHN|nr:hypothetical protein [Sphingobium lignivorans]MBB5985977.1 hypothetical protein [Sphingobium lignivorans]
MEPWKVGDLVRYDYGPSAVMRINYVHDMGPDQPGCAPYGMNRWRYYGRAFHDTISHYDNGEERASTGRYHGQCMPVSEEDVAKWQRCHDENDDWIRGAWS